MWIRSQDGKKLLEMTGNELYVYDGAIFCRGLDSGSDVPIGLYAENRLMKVMDNISRAIAKGMAIYYMPEE